MTGRSSTRRPKGLPTSLEPFGDPRGQLLFTDRPVRDAFDGGDGLVTLRVVGGIGPCPAVTCDELQRAEVADQLVAVRQWMVADQPRCQDRGLAREVG